MLEAYGRDLAHVHDGDHGDFARDAAPGVLGLAVRRQAAAVRARTLSGYGRRVRFRPGQIGFAAVKQ